jgi:hypothetical protein
MMDDSVLAKATTSGVPYEDLMAAPRYARPYTQSVGVAIPPELAAPAGAQLVNPQPVQARVVPQVIGTRDERVAPWSADVPDMAADLPERVARATPSPAQSTRRPSRPAPAPFGSARIPNGGGRGG